MAKPSRRKSSRAKVLSSRAVFHGPVFRVTTDTVLEPGGIRARRDIVRHPGSVVILALDESSSQPHILLERQYRHAADGYLWELPAGRIDPGESELAAAKRELLEETGYTSTQWERMFKCFVSPGFMDETMAIYLARRIRPGKAQPEADELIRKRLIPLPEALRMVRNGTIHDAKTISAILWLKIFKTASKARF
ncbi:MAG TPA: NUDIX hydrolase [Terriglobales bacterium]|nr:NUDIX hydrolase [Terriglobales bacterium]